MDRTDSLDLVGTVRVDEVATLVRRVCELALFSASQFLLRVGSTHLFASRSRVSGRAQTRARGQQRTTVNKEEKEGARRDPPLGPPLIFQPTLWDHAQPPHFPTQSENNFLGVHVISDPRPSVFQSDQIK